ncbi:hypothetical protein [Virgibacillus proomii]|nr:hypothetical protein [Virgibacillus proomii]MBU5265863.1 hypothetical protein [Virgibacillus proomii]
MNRHRTQKKRFSFSRTRKDCVSDISRFFKDREATATIHRDLQGKT